MRGASTHRHKIDARITTRTKVFQRQSKASGGDTLYTRGERVKGHRTEGSRAKESEMLGGGERPGANRPKKACLAKRQAGRQGSTNAEKG